MEGLEYSGYKRLENNDRGPEQDTKLPEVFRAKLYFLFYRGVMNLVQVPSNLPLSLSPPSLDHIEGDKGEVKSDLDLKKGKKKRFFLFKEKRYERL